MNEKQPRGANRYGHLLAQAAAQKAATVTRLETAIQTLQVQGRPISGPSIVAVGGPAFAVIRRNPAAYALYRQYSTFHSGRQHDSSALPASPSGARPMDTPSPDPLRGRTRAYLARELRNAWNERDHAYAERDLAEDRYQRLLSEHQQWGETIARLQAALVNDAFRKRVVDFAQLEQLDDERQ